MTRMEKHIIHQRIGRLLDMRCRNCPNNNLDHAVVCTGCNIYDQLRMLGNQLDHTANRQNTARRKVYDFKGLSIPIYVYHRNKGLHDDEIAPLVGLSVWMLKQWKRQNRLELDKLIEQGVIPKYNRRIKKDEANGTNDSGRVSQAN